MPCKKKKSMQNNFFKNEKGKNNWKINLISWFLLIVNTANKLLVETTLKVNV